MIKIQHKILKERGIVEFQIESSREDDLPTLDIFNEALQGPYEVQIGFTASNKLTLQVRGMDKSIFEDSTPLEP